MCHACGKVVKSGWQVVCPWMGSYHNWLKHSGFYSVRKFRKIVRIVTLRKQDMERIYFLGNAHHHHHHRSSSSSSSSSSSYHEVGPLVDSFRSHTSRSLLNGLPWFLLPIGLQIFFFILGTLLPDVLWNLPVARISALGVTRPEQGKPSSRTATLNLWTGMFWGGISSITD